MISPRYFLALEIIFPDESVKTAPAPAGPGFPLAPPSVKRRCDIFENVFVNAF